VASRNVRREARRLIRIGLVLVVGMPWLDRWRLRITVTPAGTSPATVTGIVTVRPG